MPPEFFLVGDSHAIGIAEAATVDGIAFRGGALGSGYQLAFPFFEVDGCDFVLTHEPLQHRADEFRDLLRFDGPILSTVGFNTHSLCDQITRHLGRNAFDYRHLSRQLLERCIVDCRRGAVCFYEAMRDAGRHVHFVCAPQRWGRDAVERRFAVTVQDILVDSIRGTGAELIDLRPETMEGDFLQARFLMEDPADASHGNHAWSRLALQRFREAAGLPPHRTVVVNASELSTTDPWRLPVQRIPMPERPGEWHGVEGGAGSAWRWSGPGRRACMRLPIRRDARCEVRILVVHARDRDTGVEVFVDGIAQPFRVAEGDVAGSYTAIFECDPAGAEQIDLALVVSSTFRSVDLGIGDDVRELGIAVSGVEVRRVG